MKHWSGKRVSQSKKSIQKVSFVLLMREFLEPGFSTNIRLPLRRTLVLPVQ